MSSEPQPREEIFAFALRIPEPTARAAYLARACGEDAALRAEVESLIAADEAADGFMRAVNHAKSWIPADDLEELNNNIVALIEVIREFSEGKWAWHLRRSSSKLSGECPYGAVA